MIEAIDYALYEALPFVPMALGLVLTLRYLKFVDIAAATSFVLGAAVMARLLVDGHSVAVALLASILLTIAISALTSFLMVCLRFDPLLAGVVSSYAGYSLALLFTRGSLSILASQNPFSTLAELDFPHSIDRIPLHPWSIALFAVVAAISKLLIDTFLNSEMGLAFRAMEDSRGAENFLPSLGLSPAWITTGAIMAGGMLAMTSGVLIALKEGQVNAQRGFDVLISVVAAFLIGGAAFERRPVGQRTRGRIARVLGSIQRLRASSAAIAGVLLYFVLLQAVASFNLPQSTPRLILAALLVVVLAVTRTKEVSRWLRGRQVGKTVCVADREPFSADHIHVSYPGHLGPNIVVSDASICIQPGEVFRLQGPNGSGKSTLLRFLAGEIEGEGRVRVPCHPNVKADRRQLIAYVSQDSTRSTIATLTVREHLSVVQQRGRRSWLRRPKMPRDHSGLPDIPAGSLSGGQRQLLNLVCVKERAVPPRVVLLDEPFNHLDRGNAEACGMLIGDLAKDGRSIALVRHVE